MVEGERSRLVRIGRNFSWGAAGAVTVGGLALLRTSVLTRAFSLEDYGRLVLVISLSVFLTAFVSVRVGDSLYSFYPRFLASGELGALHALLVICLAVCLALGGMLTLVLYLGSGMLATYVYHDPLLIGPLRAYSIVPILLSMAEFTVPLLRLNDRFRVVALSQAFGSLTALVIIVAYVARIEIPSLTLVTGLMALLVVLQGVPPLGVSLWVCQKVLRHGTLREAFGELKPYRKELGTTFMHTNLVGYLKLASAPGDQFLLGLTSSAEQVALYGFARQLTAPLSTLQSSVHAALLPETTSLYAKGSWGELRGLLRQYFRWAAAAGAACVLVVALLVRPVIRVFATPDYLPAAGPTILLALTVALALFTSPSYPIGVVSGRLQRYNLTQVVGVAILALYLLLFDPTAMGLAVAVLLGVIAVILGFALPVYRSVFSKNRS